MKRLFLGLMFSLVAAASAIAQPAQPTKTKMTIATGIDPSLAAFYIGKLGGFFEKNGLDVSINTGSSGSAMVPFLVKNQVHAVLAAESAGIQTNAIDPDVVVVAEMLRSGHGYIGIVGRNVPDIDALKGKKVGVHIGSASEVFWRAFIEKTKATPKDYTVVPVENPEMIAALQRGDIDAIATFEPWLTRAMAAVPQTKMIRDSEGIINIRSYVYMNKGWVSENAAATEAFIRSLLQATDFIHQKPDEAAQYVSTFLKMDLALTKLLMTKMNYAVRFEPDSVDHLKTVERQLTQTGKLTKPVEWGSFVYAEPLKKVQGK